MLRRYFYEIILRDGTIYYNQYDNYYDCDKVCDRVCLRHGKDEIYFVRCGFDNKEVSYE